MTQSDWLGRKAGFEAIDRLGRSGTPFLFILSYDKKKIFARAIEKLPPDIRFKCGRIRNDLPQKRRVSHHLSAEPISFKSYTQALVKVQEEIRAGNTYLLNLTFRTPIETDLDLEEIFHAARAKYKLFFRNQFICFSPERFVEIRGNTISAFPMKGTIEASLPNAERIILSNPKEMAEHVMIVDLMRNDLSIVAKNVYVKDFRYVDRIWAGDKELLQVSSRINGTLSSDWHDHIGGILDKLTPAGSITGTPKRSTTEIIHRIEGYDRGFYTGVFGIFDGHSLHSAVMIRFIERKGTQLFYKSGGGITLDSDAQSEYEELLDKIYLPF